MYTYGGSAESTSTIGSIRKALSVLSTLKIFMK